MKAVVLILFFAVCYECRKAYAPINKNANIDFINNEGGGYGSRPAAVEPPKPAPAPAPAQAPKSPLPQTPVTKPTAPVAKPATQPQKPAQPSQTPTQIKPVPVNPAPVANPITTPGPGNVKSLITFYDSQGKASVIRPYSYSQAVKQG